MTGGSLSELDHALGILRSGEEYLASSTGMNVAHRLGDLRFFDADEFQEVQNLQARIRGYIDAPKPRRPLNIAIFGPPGSGKSHAVKAIQLEMCTLNPSRALPFFEINLTQVETSAHLQSELRYIKRAVDTIGSSGHARTPGAEPVPFVFFDEFDAPRAGAPLGWLDWFLSPMNDGVIGHGEHKFDFRQAIYVFAGGTASSLRDFTDLKSREFVEAKGPDFISRISVSLNVRGPNHEVKKLLRRASVIRQFFSDSGNIGSGTLKRPIGRDFAICLLYQGRFKHGSRSIVALCEYARNDAEKLGTPEILKENLPDQHMLELHVDQGELDPEHIGGLIGISIGKEHQSDPHSSAANMFKKTVTSLWEHGATIAYGGHWNQDLTKGLLVELKARETPQAESKHRVEIFSRDDKNIPTDVSHAVVVPTFSSWSAVGDDAASKRAAKAVSDVRMRWAMSSRCVARIVVGGDIGTPNGRMHGLLEEIVFALALGQPIYVLGAFPGIGPVIGKLLGLGSAEPKRNAPQTDAARVFAPLDPALLTLLERERNCFQPMPGLTLPMAASEAADFLSRYAVGGKLWPDNGLRLDENRQLFAAEDADVVSDLIMTGLHRRFGR